MAKDKVALVTGELGMSDITNDSSLYRLEAAGRCCTHGSYLIIRPGPLSTLVHTARRPPADARRTMPQEPLA